ncbi:MAG: flagellar export protein FliJ [Epulopiscium sp.]|nr:flagellar export protein FliJ [Candidatus Epulonipiscium sp.]
MGRFQFRLDNILNIREKLEDKKKQEYGEASTSFQNEKEIKHQLINKTDNIFCGMRDMLENKITPREVLYYNQYIGFLKERIIEQNKKVEDAARHMENKRCELLEVVKQRKMLESLKEKQKAAFLEEVNKSEQKIIDEIISFKSQNRLRDRGKTSG